MKRLALEKSEFPIFLQNLPINYSLDVVISVGYRVKSQQGTQFRIWATQRIKEYIVKGFALNDDRFKSGNSINYFNELQNRIRDPSMKMRTGIANSPYNQKLINKKTADLRQLSLSK